MLGIQFPSFVDSVFVICPLANVYLQNLFIKVPQNPYLCFRGCS